MTQEQLMALSDSAGSTLFSPGEKVAIEFAEAMTREGRVSDDLWERLRAQWDEGQIVEIAAVVGLFNYFNRWNEAISTPVTDPRTLEYVRMLLPEEET